MSKLLEHSAALEAVSALTHERIGLVLVYTSSLGRSGWTTHGMPRCRNHGAEASFRAAHCYGQI